MIKVNKHTLDNGLRLVHQEDRTTQMVALTVLYDVGSRDENENHTGFAHLFEHLMFGGSVHIPDYDAPVQNAGGDNNAWTNNDLTNYYLTLPKENVEVGFWLESDRMLGLDFNEKSLEVQRQVVIEEFKQRHLNQPYGDSYHLLYKMAFEKHPYQWPTIGKCTEHIAQATMEEVKAFFYSHYAPNNAVLAVTGNIPFEEAVRLAEKWFGPIPRREIAPRCLPVEPKQTVHKEQTVHRDVPVDALYMGFHMCGHQDEDYKVFDMLSDVLSNGKSTRLEQILVQELRLCTGIDAFITGTVDPGLFLISAKPATGVTTQQVEQAVWEQLERLKQEPVGTQEMEKVKNRYESEQIFNSLNYLNVANNLAYFELLGDANDFNREVEKYRAVTPERLMEVARRAFVPENCSVLHYLRNEESNPTQP